MARPVVVANWKAQLSPKRERALAGEIARRLTATSGLLARVELVLAPSALSLATISHELEGLGLDLALAAQDCSDREPGAHTGELTAHAIATLAGTVILGHAERRRDDGDHGRRLGMKLARAVAAGLRPILCFDDPLDATLASRATHFATEWRAIGDGFAAGGGERAALAGSRLLLAYEPQAAIGSGVALDPSAAGEAAAALRDVVGADLPVLYGGSIAGAGAAAYRVPAGERRIDGLLVGGAALDADRLLAVVSSLAG